MGAQRWHVLVGCALLAVIGCKGSELPTAPGGTQSAKTVPRIRSGPLANMVSYWVCQETTWLSDGTSVIDCFLEYYDDGSGSGVPNDPGLPPPAIGGGGSGEAGSGAGNPDEWTVEEDAFPACPGGICNHVSIANSLTWVGCPARIFWTDDAGPHGPEVWSVKLVGPPKWDWWAMAMVGHYTGTSVINGFPSQTAYARNTCDVGWVTFHSQHPG